MYLVMIRKNVCPLILLDSNLEENSEAFQKLTDQLYRSDDVWWKIYQRIILGIGGMKSLEGLDYQIDQCHLNEGHAAFSLAQDYAQGKEDDSKSKKKKVFTYTCHTPVEAGHDRFALSDIQKYLNGSYIEAIKLYGREKGNDDLINLTLMCLENCRDVNAVAQKHGEVTRLQFPKFADKIEAITNGVHIPTWVSDSFEGLFNKYSTTFGDWKKNPDSLFEVESLKSDNDFRKDIFNAHQVNKQNLLEVLRHWRLDENVLTIGWARRITGYKRPALIFHDVKRLIDLAYNKGPLQIIFAGKAHPNDDIGSAHIEAILDHIDELNEHSKVIKVLILENYDTYFGKLLTSSVDVWLNNPLPPFEASGTSGMKAILNGVLQLSTLDGWVVEAADKDIGWIFGYEHLGNEVGSERELRLEEDSQALYNTLENVIDLYYQMNKGGVISTESAWIDKMIHCVHQSAFFNSQRMIKQYQKDMW